MGPLLFALVGGGSAGSAMLLGRFSGYFLALAVAGLATSFYLTWWKNPTRANRFAFFAAAVVVLSTLAYRVGGELGQRTHPTIERRPPVTCSS